ncbi:MAG: hypothetical protein IJ939_01815 [Clostridia bacterium]|nr:hypothetical protein [Clostridia bacterium]
MKKYTSPEIEFTIFESNDILFSSADMLDQLPDGDEMPRTQLGTGLWSN